MDEKRLLRGEKGAVNLAITLSEKYGFGNMISWIATAWAERLYNEGLDIKSAESAVSNRSPYPQEFLKLIERSEL